MLYPNFLCVLCLGLFSLVAQAREIKICADPDPPPWTYWIRDAQHQKTDRFTGSSVEVFTILFKRLGMPVTFIGNMPWARCLKMVQEGHIDFAMDAYYNSERAKKLAYSKSYNTLTPQVFYRKKSPIRAQSKYELKRYKGCGMIGASYAHYGLNPEDLDLGVNTYEGMIKKLKAGRCDFFVEELEVIAGYTQLGRDFLNDPALQHNGISDAQAPAKHLVTALHGENAELLPTINTALGKMQNSGELAKIWKKHARGLVFKP